MNIEILTKLKDNPKRNPNKLGYEFANEGLSVVEIEQLELDWNNGNNFPKALRELLYLGGAYCYCFSYSFYDTQNEMQIGQRELMQFRGHNLNRPFYIVDSYEGSEFLFVYLDEDQLDPAVYLYSSGSLDNGRPLGFSLGYTLSHLINLGVDTAKSNY